MYLHLGKDVVVRFDEIIGIFDIETSTISKHSRDFLAKAEKSGQVVTVSYEMPKSFIVCNESDNKILDEKNVKVYISQISSATLKKRASFLIDTTL